MTTLSFTSPDIQALPFLGLGMSLGRVLVKAQALIRLAVIKEFKRAPALTAAGRMLSGYELLVLQGREIRGQ